MNLPIPDMQKIKVKRVLDLVLVLPLLVILSPLLLIIAFLVWLDLGLPILFRQTRPGLHGRPFTIYKFRTMTQSLDTFGNVMEDGHRITKIGGFLRSTSLDELPEFFNILAGEMSLVGPRPLLMSYLTLYSEDQRRRHDVPPGLTGWAQINGRNTRSWPDRLALDLWYVQNWTVLLDLKILTITIWKVVRREGINQPGRATVDAFTGNGE
ncbi:MAG: epsL [Chthoniobacteraceae bacterium]|nr:epsL [Chthoniobacteraceae bacterium]